MGKKKSSSSSRQKAKTASDSKVKLGDPATDNRNLERNIVQNAADWLPQAFPKALRPFFHGPALEVMRCVYKDKVQLYLMMKKFINEAKDGASRVHMIIFKPVPLNVIQNDMLWDYNIAPHCRFTYLEAQQTLFLNIATETRMIEHFPKTELNFDDTDMGVQGHALGRFKYGLKKQLSAMGIVDNRWEFACARSRHSLGLIHDKKDNVPYKAIHTADRMFIPGIIRHPKYDANNQPWPTMAIECCDSCTNLASRLYLECSVDWWFSQSEGFTKVVILMMFDYDRRGTVIEKWVCTPKAPYTKRLAQTILIDVTRGENGKPTVTIDGDDLVLDFESLMACPKREGETDIVFDKALMNGFGNGHLMTWPNLGKGRKQNAKRSGIDVTTARKLLDCPLSTLQQHLGPALDEALEKAEKAAKAVGADADVQASRMTLTLTRNKVDKGKGKEKEGELASGEDRIPVDITIGEALAIMAEKEGVEEEK
ncbi:hypothetical protein ZTR_09871 [Talaromyces verruculosus]|nr:hypothetical protein ZTR_09871 [Talaromyces verruculosus]